MLYFEYSIIANETYKEIIIYSNHSVNSAIILILLHKNILTNLEEAKMYK